MQTSQYVSDYDMNSLHFETLCQSCILYGTTYRQCDNCHTKQRLMFKTTEAHWHLGWNSIPALYCIQYSSSKQKPIKKSNLFRLKSLHQSTTSRRISIGRSCACVTVLSMRISLKTETSGKSSRYSNFKFNYPLFGHVSSPV